MRNVRRLTVLVAVVAGLAMLASCTGNGSDGTRAGGRSGQVFVFGTAAEPVVLDGAQVRSIEAARVVSQLFETLVERKLDGTGFEPGLARSWEASADGRTWTFRLQRGVRFHDGTPFDARAVCANFERWYHFRGIQQTMAVALSWRDVFGGFATQDDPSAPKTSLYRSCEARTDDEGVIDFNEPSGRFLSAVAAWPFSIASPDALRRYEADKVTGTPAGPRVEGTFGTEHPIGTGPVKLER